VYETDSAEESMGGEDVCDYIAGSLLMTFSSL